MPRQRCCLCPNKYPQFSLHRFPSTRHHNIFLQWLDIMPEEIKKTDPATLRQKYVVCESHFNRDDYFAGSGKRRLKWNSLPKIEPTDCATPRMKRTSSSMGCTPRHLAMYKDIPSTVVRNIDKSPEVEVVSVGLHEILGDSPNNIGIINDITVPSTDDIQAASEIENTPRQDCSRNGRKRTISTTRTLKKRRLDMTDSSIFLSDLSNINDAPPSIDTNCHGTLSSEILEGEDITLLPMRQTYETVMQNATAVSPASIVPVANNLASGSIENYTASGSVENDSVSGITENDPASGRICTSQRKRPKSAVYQLEQIVSNTNKENVSTTTATLRQRNRGCYRRRRRYQSKYNRPRKTLTEDIKKEVQQFCYSKLKKPICRFVEMQIENQQKNKQKNQERRRWTVRLRAMAALWLKLGPRSYNVLRRLRFTLPSKRMIMRLLSDIAFEPGINEGVIQSLKKSVSLMRKDVEKLCYITFGEMNCRESLHYNIKQDIIVGFKDFGGGCREPTFANHVMVVMVCGIARAWKQAIAFYFTDGKDSIHIKAMVEDIIKKLHEIGLRVLATVCDTSSSNISAINNLLEETRVAFVRKGEEKKHFGFLIEDKEVIPLFDPPHLLEAFRDNLIKKNLKFKVENKWYEASWSDIVTLYEHDCANLMPRNCNKLTEYHIDPEKGGKMEVKYAAEVFSNTVFYTFRFFLHDSGVFANKERAGGTAQLVLFFDRLFDSVNGYIRKVETCKFLYSAVTQTSKHRDFWNKAIQTLSSMEFEATGQDEKKPPCLVKWIETLKGFEYLWEVLRDKYDFLSLIPRDVNQDGLKNFFSGIRRIGGQNPNPTIYQFIGLFKTMLISSCTIIKPPWSVFEYDKVLSPVLSLIEDSKKLEKDERGNIVKNVDVLITQLEFLYNLNLESSDPDEHFDDITVELSDMAKCSNKALFRYKVRKSTRFYLAGFLAIRAAKCVHHCDNCKMELLTDDLSEDAGWILTRRRGEIRKLELPDTQFFRLFSEMYDVAKMAVPQISYRSQVRGILKHIIRKTLRGKFFFSCIEHDLFEIFLNLFTTFYIRIWILTVNRILHNKNLRQVDDEIKKLALEVLRKRTGRIRKMTQMKSK